MTTSSLVLISSLVVALVAYSYYSSSLYSYLGPGISCSERKEEFVQLIRSQNGIFGSSSIHVNACHVFSDSYRQARAKFRHATQQIATAQLVVLPVSMDNDDDDTDNDDNAYTIDIAIVSGNAKGFTIHSSGVHGVEGYAGSAIQIAALELLHNTADDDGTENVTLPVEFPTLVFIHAVNPYGMAHFRRFNEHNVDLNRNGLTATEWENYAKHHSNRVPYDTFDALFNFPTDTPPTIWNAYVWLLPKMIRAIAHHGIATLKAALVGGQYHKPTGVFYGGQKSVERSFIVLQEWLQVYLKGHLQAGAAVTWIDVHTGLGKFGNDVLLPHRGASAAEFQTWFPDASSAAASSSSSANNKKENAAAADDDDGAASDVAQGYENVKGFMIDYFRPLLIEATAGDTKNINNNNNNNNNRVLLFAQEFGTLPSVLVGHALIVENAAHQHFLQNNNNNNKKNNEEKAKQLALAWAKKCLRPAFYPNHPDWRKSILQRGLRVLEQSMERSKQYLNVVQKQYSSRSSSSSI